MSEEERKILQEKIIELIKILPDNIVVETLRQAQEAHE